MRLIDADYLLNHLGDDINSPEAREENRGTIITAEDIDRMPTIKLVGLTLNEIQEIEDKTSIRL